MINVVGSTPPPAAPLPPELPGTPPTDPTKASQPVNISSGGASSTPPVLKKKSKLPKKYLLGGLLLFLLVVGSGIGLYLMKLNQDLRQQASAPYNEGVCNQSSASNCAGQPVDHICDNNPPGSGRCAMLSDGACTCRRNDAQPTPTPTPRRATPTPTPTPEACAQVITFARNPDDDACEEFVTPCDVPDGWEEVESCEDEPAPTATPTPTSGPANTPTPTPTGAVNPTPTPTTQAGGDDDDDQLADAGDQTGGQQTGGTTKGGQPALPSELPQTGPEDWLKYLQIGLGILGAGALLLLFL